MLNTAIFLRKRLYVKKWEFYSQWYSFTLLEYLQSGKRWYLRTKMVVIYVYPSNVEIEDISDRIGISHPEHGFFEFMHRALIAC